MVGENAKYKSIRFSKPLRICSVSYFSISETQSRLLLIQETQMYSYFIRKLVHALIRHEGQDKACKECIFYLTCIATMIVVIILVFTGVL